MAYIIIPLALIAVVGLSGLNIKLAFFVADRVEDSGFGHISYMMTVLGLTAGEISFSVWLMQ